MQSFTEIEQQLKQAEGALSKIDVDRLSENERIKLQCCLSIISSMGKSGLWDKYCLFNLQYIGDTLNSHLIRATENPIQNLDILFTLCARFLFELDLALTRNEQELNRSGDLYDALRKLKQEIYGLSDSFENHQLIFAMYEMPIHILNFYMGKKGLQTFIEYDKKRKEAESALQKMQSELQAKTEEAERLKESLDGYNTAFNFVGLSKGFENLLGEKRKSRHWILVFLSSLGVVSLVPLIVEFWFFINGNEITWQRMLPIITLEFILIYFFRVVLSQYQGIQTQIMQLELRQALCQFIQSYADYAKGIKKDDGSSLEKFENLIFSSILANSDKIPGTFDGVESLTSLLKEWKGK